MKKLVTLFAAALVMLAAASCEKNEVLPEGNTAGKVVTLKASINNGETKTSLGAQGTDDKYPVLWTLADNDTDREADAIAVIQNGIVYKFNLVSVDDNGQGTFELDAQENENEFDKNGEIKAFYPYAGVTCNDGTIIYNVPDTQVYVEKSFGNGASPMAAYRAAGTSGALSFQNLFGVLKLRLKGGVVGRNENERISTIDIVSDKELKGEAVVEIKNSGSEISFEDNAENRTITLNGDVDIIEETDLLIALPVGSHSLQITIRAHSDIYTLNTNQVIEAGNIIKMPLLDFQVAYIENGKYLGDGVALSDGNGGSIIWAPVNCGYDADHEYGLLYQWGRKDGQDYSISNDKIVPLESGVEPEADKFYTNWNSDSWDDSPCPMGWRIPTIEELKTLPQVTTRVDMATGDPTTAYTGVWQTINDANDKHNGLTGTYFYGNTAETSGPKVFLPAAGCITQTFQGGFTATTKDSSGWYWSSDKDGDSPKIMSFHSWGATFENGSCVKGYSVRCVKE